MVASPYCGAVPVHSASTSLYYGKVKVGPFPAVVRIEPASSCNLRCQHCPTGLGFSPAGLMIPETFRRIVPTLKKYVDVINMIVFYHGGEPLLNKELDAYIRTVREFYGGGIKLVTNGKLLDASWVERLLEAEIDVIEVSLDGISGSENDRIRLRSDHSLILQNIKNAYSASLERSNKQRVVVSTTQFVDDYLIDETPVPEAPTPTWLRAELGTDIEIKSTWAVQWPGQYPPSAKVAFRESRQSRSVQKCSLLQETVTVRSNGDVVVCCYDLTSLHVIGNVKSQSLDEIWKSPDYKEFRSSFEKGMFREPCKSCQVITGRAFLSRNNLIDV